MNTIRFFFKLSIGICFFCFISSCQANIQIEDDDQMVLEPAYEDLLTSINLFEHDNNFVIDPPTRKINWGFVLAADATPVIIGSKWGNIGLFAGACFGIVNSFIVGIFFPSCSEELSTSGQMGVDWKQEAELLKNIEIDNLEEMVGVIHNSVLQQLMIESETVDYSSFTDWELFQIVEQKVAEYLPEEQFVTRTQFDEIMETFPISRNYNDLDSFEGACYNKYPSLSEDFTVAFRVLSTIAAQKTEEQLDCYEDGVIQLIKDSSISEESKKGLIGTVSVQRSSKDFWYD